MSHSRSTHRGARWAGQGEAVVAAAQDRRKPPDAGAAGDDLTTLAGALRAKQRIERYWRERGRVVRCTVAKGFLGLFELRSDAPGTPCR